MTYVAIPALIILGCVISFAREASKYIVKNKFKPTYWWDENGHPFLISIGISIIVYLLTMIDPALPEIISAHFGINIPIPGESTNMSLIILGAGVASWTYEFFNQKKATEKNKEISS